MEQNVKVALLGFGAMGEGIARTLLGKKGVEITAVCIRNPVRAGKEMHELLGLTPNQPEVFLHNDIDKAIAPGSCDVCIISTDSFIKDVFDKIVKILEKGINVITIAEEMAYPWAQEPELAKKLDEIAKANGVSVLGTGINPGLVMDLLAICLSGCMTDVSSVMCKRINSLSPFGVTVMEEQGIGLEVDVFNARVESGEMSGHVGFAESVGMIDTALGLGVDTFRQQMEPIITSVDRKSPYGFAGSGHVAGVNMTGQGLRGGEVIVDMIHPQQIEPELGGVSTGDYIVLEGTPRVNMQISPEINGGDGTIAMAVNCIPQVINADPGVITMIDIPVPHAIMGDFRDYVKPAKRIVK